MNIDQKFIENYLTLKDDDPVVFKLFPWQQEIVDAALAAAKKGNKLAVYRARPQGMSMVVLEFIRLAQAAGLLKLEDLDYTEVNKWHTFMNKRPDLVNEEALSLNKEPLPVNTWWDFPGVIRKEDVDRMIEMERFKFACLQERERWADGEYFMFHPSGKVDKKPFDPETWKRVKEKSE